MSQTSQPDPPPAASDIPAVADLPAVVHVPAANDLPATGDNPAASGLPASGDLPATGDLPASGGLPAAGDTPAADPYALAPVLVGFAGRLPQRRATVLIRIVLALPQLVVLSVIGLVSLWVAVAGWFAALVTGRLPQFAGQYLTGFVRWQARLLAYLLFLTDAYPPFTFEDADYPVRLYTRPVRLNRAAVLFRLVLALPAAVLGQLATAGLIAWSCVVWLIALIGGIVPEPLYQAIAATIRFNARYSGYALLLSATYPSGLFGDEQRLAGPAREPQATAELPATPEPRPNPEPRPAPEQQPNPEPGASDGTLPASPPVPAPQGAVPQPGPADPWALVLSGRAKALVAVCVASGLLLWAGYGAVAAGLTTRPAGRAAAAHSPAAVPPGSSHSKNTTLELLNRAYSALTRTLTAAESSADNCGGNRHCIEVQIDGIGADFTTFSTAVTNALQGISVPAGAADAAADLQYEASQATVEFAVLGQATSAAQYRSELKSGGAEQTLNLMSADFSELVSALRAKAGAA